MRIDAAVLEEVDGPLAVGEIELEEPRDDEVLVRVHAAAICHSDIAARRGDLPLPMPVILGHEGAGVVEAAGAGVRKVAPGDHVALTFTSCGHCGPCQGGHPVYCDHSAAMNLSGTRGDGSTAYRRGGEEVYGHFVGQSTFATHVVASERSVVKVDDDLPMELLAPLGCGVQTGAGTVMNVLRPPYGSSFAAIGAGTVGLSALMAAVAVGCETVIAVDVVGSRLELAAELGATRTIDSREGDLTERLLEATGGRGVDFCVDTTGLGDVVAAAYAGLAVRGTLGLVGVSPAGTRFDFEPWSFLPGRTVTGNMEGDVVPDRFIPYLLGLYRQGRFPLDRLITGCGGLEDLGAAVAAVEGGEVVKAVVTVGGPAGAG